MPNRAGYSHPSASDCRDSQGRGRLGSIRTFGQARRLASSASSRPCSSSCPGRARLDSVAGWQRRCSARAAAVVAARQACQRTTAAAAWSRGRHQRAASRHRPGCRAAHQAGDACGSSRWALPARTTEIIETTRPGCLARRRLPSAAGPFSPIEHRSCWPGKLGEAGASRAVPKRVLPSRHRPAAPSVASRTNPHSQGDQSAVPYSTSALARKLIVYSATTR